MDKFDNEIDNCLNVLQNGGIILYPTDTIWGLGCDATNSVAVNRIYKIKRRMESKSLIVLVDRFSMVSEYVKNVPVITEDLLNSISHPVTVIYSEARRLAENVIASDGTIGIRIIKDEFCNKLINKFGKPIVSTSANISGDPSPIMFKDIVDEIKNEVDYIVQIKHDTFTRSKPSTIIRLNDDGMFTILRE